ncbi:MAG: DUF4249 family protein [Bacteroidetes bacterium]|nr:DUF4249 family protein [Bacteroidota bacterium]
MKNFPLRLVLLAGIAALLLPACNQDLDVTAPYKENTIIYALLDRDSTTQYVRINKAFLGPGNAFVYAQVPDSTEYQDGQLQAEVQAIKNGVVVNTYALRDTLLPHDPGTFAGPTHKMYCFNAVLDSSATYRIMATAKGNQVSAATAVVGAIRPFSSTIAQPLRLVPLGGGYADQTIRWLSSENGSRYELSYRFNWDEVSGSDTVSKSFTQAIGTVFSSDLVGGQTMDTKMGGEAFFQTVALRVGNNPNVTQRIFRGIDLMWAVAAPDLNLYMQVASPISGLVEERPVYTNVENGYGLFSSRRFKELHKTLDANSIPELVQGHYTAGLLFCVPGSSFPFGCN